MQNMDQEHMADAVMAGLKTVFGGAAMMVEASHKELLTCQEAELVFNYPISTQEKDRAAGIGPAFIKKGKRVLYRRRDLEGYFASLRVKTRDQA